MRLRGRLSRTPRIHPAWMAVFLLLAGTAVALGNDFTIKSTGQNVTGAGQDMNYKITSDGADGGAAGAAVLVNMKSGSAAIGWGANTPASQWIAPTADQSNATRAGTCCVGDTVYRTDFDLTGLEPSSASLTLFAMADDYVVIFLNGGDDAHRVYSPPNVMYGAPVTIPVKSGFVAGNNFLEFHVHNFGGPTGLNVYGYGSADPVVTGPPVLEISPSFIAMTAVKGSPFSQADTVGVFIRNVGGGGPQPLQFGGLADTPQCHHVNNQGFFALNLPTTTKQLDPALLLRTFATNPINNPVAPGFYRSNMRFTSGSLTADVCVNFLLTDGPISFSLSKTGLVFHAQAKTDTLSKQPVTLFAGAGPVNWTASSISQGDFIVLSATSGTTSSTPGSAGSTLTVSIKPKTLSDPGIYYGLIEVKPQTPGVLPQLITVVATVTAIAPVPDLSTAGMVFAVTPGATPAAQILSLLPSTSGSQPFTLSATGGFLTIGSPSGSLGGTAATPVSVSVNPNQLRLGQNRGSIQLTTGGATRTIDVVAISGVTTGCKPAQLVAIGTSLAGNFSQTAGWPTVYQVRVVDDCGNPVTAAKVELSFSNGDPNLTAALEDAKSGTYTATWNPVQTGPVTVTARATSGSLDATTTTAGAVTAGAGPILTPHGTAHNFNAQPGSPLAPGTMAVIPGANLSTVTDLAGLLPLPLTLDGVKVTIAGIDVPIYGVDPGQISVQIPVELPANAIYPVVVSVNGAVSGQDSIVITDVAPGVAVNADGTLNALHQDMTAVTADSPAVPGETIIALGSGFGVTNPAVATNTLAPMAEPLARLVNPVTVTVDSNSADTPYEGLAPGGIGLYQIQFTIPSGTDTTQIPDGATSINLAVVITQNGQTANPATVPVGIAPPAAGNSAARTKTR